MDSKYATHETHVKAGGAYRQPEHSVASQHFVVNQDLSPDQTWAADFLESNNTSSLDVNLAQVDKIKSIGLRYTVTPTGDQVILPPELQFDHIAFRTKGGSNEEVCRWNGQALWWVNSGMKESRKCRAIRCNNTGEETNHPGLYSVLKGGVAHDQYLDLSATYFGLSNPYGPAFEHKVRINTQGNSHGFQLRTDSDGLTAAGGAMANTTTPLLQIEHYSLIDSEHRAHEYAHNHPRVDRCLVPTVVRPTIATLTASTKATLVGTTDLSSLNGHCAFVLIGIRTDNGLAQFSTGADEMLTYQPLGDGATIDLVNERGETLLHKGTSHTVRYINERMDELLPNDFLKNRNVYMISFSEDPVADMWTGKSHGSLEFKNKNWRIEITPDAVGTAQVVTFVDSGNAITTADNFHYEFDGKRTRSLPCDASLAICNHELAKLLGPHGLRATADEALVGGGGQDGNQVVTFAGARRMNGKELHIVAEAGPTSTYVPADATYVRATDGFLADANHAGSYTVDMQFFMWDEFILKNGSVSKRRWQP